MNGKPKPIGEANNGSKDHWLIIVVVMVMAVLVGGSTYWAMQLSLDSIKMKIDVLENRVENLQVVPQAEEEVCEEETITAVKPTIISPENGATIDDPSEEVVFKGKAEPNSSVWLFAVSEMDPACLTMDSVLSGPEMVGENGNYEITYLPSSQDSELGPRPFAVVSIDTESKYEMSWVNGVFCLPLDIPRSNDITLNLAGE